MSQCICVVQQLHSEHHIHTPDLLSLYRKILCVPGTHRTVWAKAADPQKSWTKVLQLLGNFGFTGCTRKNRSAHVQDACILTMPSEIISALHIITLPTVYQTLINSGKKTPNSVFWLGQNFCKGRGDLLRDPGSTDTRHILRSPKFKKSYTLNSHWTHPGWLSMSSRKLDNTLLINLCAVWRETNDTWQSTMQTLSVDDRSLCCLPHWRHSRTVWMQSSAMYSAMTLPEQGCWTRQGCSLATGPILWFCDFKDRV